jgi:RND family efflux transporter MFP subunit
MTMRYLPKTRRGALLLAISAIALAGAGAASFSAFKPKAEAAAEAAPQGPPPAPVRVAEAVSAELAPHAGAPGSVVSVNDSLIAAATPGPVIWVAEIGAELAAGDVIARIDPVDALAARDEARAEVGRLRARATQAARLVERYEGLGEDGGESEAAIDELRANRDAARQELARAEVGLRRAETALDRTDVRAPFAGRIVDRAIDIGEYVNAGATVARLVDIGAMEVTARAADTLLASLRPGDMIRVTSGADAVDATVRAVVPVGDLASRTHELRLALPKTGWRVGAAVEVSLPRSAPRRVVAVHRDALILRADRVSLFLIGEGDVARQVDVELGAADGDLIEVIGEVKAGDRVVIRGGERLRDGQKVIIQGARTAASA